MTASSKVFVRGTLTMLATIIGAGVFAIPFAMKTMGIFAGSVMYWTVATVILTAHLLYADIILHDASLRGMRLPGHATRILGVWPGHFAVISHPLNTIGATLAYLILGGEFLASLASAAGLPHAVLFWQIVFWAGGAITVFFGLKLVARVETWMAWVLIGLLGLSVFLFLPNADTGLFLVSKWGSALAPLGILVFALNAFNVLPEIVEICGRNVKQSLSAVTIGSLGAALLMWLFGVFGYAALGSSLVTDPSDVARAFPSGFFWLLPAIGFLAVATSFLTITQDLKAMIHLDLRQPKVVAWAVALGAPLILLFITERDFLGTISFIGGIFGALNGVLIAWMALVFADRAPRLKRMWIRGFASVCAMAFFLTFFWRILSLG
jgi:amino acid permease